MAADLPSLSSLAYPRRAHDVARFLDDPLDEAIAAILRSATGGSPADRAAFRDTATEAGAYALLAFARRRSVAALRAERLDLAMEAVDALTLVSRDRIDVRDLRVDLPLTVVHEIGGDAADVARRAAAASEPGTARVLTSRAESARPLRLVDTSHVAVRSDAYGFGLLDGWSARRFRPTTDLFGAAVRLCDLIDAAGRYEVESLDTSDLPEVWFSVERRTGNVATTGCLDVTAPMHGAGPWSHGLLIFVAEVDDPATATDLATRASEASTTDRPRIATAVDRRLALIVGGSGTMHETPRETQDSLAPYASLAHEAFSRDHVK